jgi:mannose-6-phosphate isomerase-like protein (cupin superfamily)
LRRNSKKLRVDIERIFMVEDCAIAPIALANGEGERVSLHGAEMVFKTEVEDAEGWAVMDYTLPANQFGAPLHCHEELTESFFVVSGELWFQLGDEEMTLQAGGFVLVPPGTPHSFANRSDAPARLLGHSSSGKHKTYLKKLFAMAEAEESWPPKDPRPFVELAKQYDTTYL